MSTRYKEFSGLHLPTIEQEVLARWEKEKTFEKSVSVREGATPFVFYEGPPSANGMPGIHHVISRTLKDMVCRYKTMQGYQVNRKGGWDTHGLPIELGVEKELGITKEDIGTGKKDNLGNEVTVEYYNKKCREAVLRYKDKWDELTKKMGYWVDLDNPYITFENNYIETLWWILSELHKKELLYESVSIQPYSPAAGTGLSSHELNQPGTYKDVKDTSATVLFKILPSSKHRYEREKYGNPEWIEDSLIAGSAAVWNNYKDTIELKEDEKDVYIMAWTTTPWTLPSNLGLTMGANIEYVHIATYNPYTHKPINVVVAMALEHKFFHPEGLGKPLDSYVPGDKIIPWRRITSTAGSVYEGVEYEQLLSFEANSIQRINETTPGAQPFKVVMGDFVTTEDGTGIVHTAPAFGADDYKIGKKNNLGILILVDRQGKFIDGVGEFSGRYVKNYKDEKDYVDVNVDISVKLKKENRAFKVEKYEHSYPHCWRTDKPILYYPLDAWFIKTTAIKDRMVELNKTINWKPKSTGEGRFGNWLENMVDWNLSRSRFWGTPLPIWKSVDDNNEYIDEKEGGESICIGSIEQLLAEAKKADEILGTAQSSKLKAESLDLHKPYVDDIILLSASGKPMKRVPDLIDVWFDSGAMPYAQWGLDYEKVKKGEKYPFKLPEGTKNFEDLFPASFICEGVDQTRGWFYTLHALGALLFDSVAFKTVVSNGLVLDKNGNKMSKRLGNVVNPFETIDKYGADATRWYLITNASPWDNLKFDQEGIKEVQRKFFGTLYNTYQFFSLYANVDGFAFKEDYIPVNQRTEIDQWILSSLNTLIKKVTESLNDYEPTAAGRLIEEFVDEHLSNWYVRLCRRRFWKGEYETDKIAAYQTLYECLETVLRLIAPISPFFSDAIFQHLNAVTGKQVGASVHHARYPIANNEVINPVLEERMQLAQDASSLVLSLRKKVALPNGQIGIKVRQPLQKMLIPVLYPRMKEQLEKVADLIKNEVNVKEIQYLTDTEGFIKKKIKPNFVALGKRLGPKMKAVANALLAFKQEDISRLEKEGSFSLLIDGEPLILQLNELEITSEDIPGWTVANKGPLTVALDITVSPELESEGNARELVNRIQKIRKDNGYQLTDRILVQITEHIDLLGSIAQFNDYICAEILADKLEVVSVLANGIEIEVNDIPLKVFVTKNA
jgi:isoleucyl-tRNA synthetase